MHVRMYVRTYMFIKLYGYIDILCTYAWKDAGGERERGREGERREKERR